MNPLEMQDYIKDICIKSGYSELTVKIQTYLMRNSFRYIRNENTILINPDRIISMANKMDLKLSIFLLFGTTHEIGHHIDFIYGEMQNDILRNEMVAWEKSRYLIPNDLINKYDDFNVINLQTYSTVLSNRYKN